MKNKENPHYKKTKLKKDLRRKESLMIRLIILFSHHTQLQTI